MENQSICSVNNNEEIVQETTQSVYSGEIVQETIHSVSLQEFSLLLKSQPRKWHPRSHRRRQIDRVPPELRSRWQESEQVYDPVMVSLGPYHHGKLELRRSEEFKHLCLDWCARGDEEKKGFFYNKILEKIDVIRDRYAEVTIFEKYNDKTLAMMMLLDACFIINYMENCINTKRNNILEWFDCLGVAASVRFIARDVLVLENQIPFQVIELLMSLQYDQEEEAKELFERFLSWLMVVDLNQAKLAKENEEPPIHLLEACWRVVAMKHATESNQQQLHNKFIAKLQFPRFLMRRRKKKDETNIISNTCSSVMDLKAKGIHFKRSSSRSLMDITFKSHAFYGQLQLPVRYVSDQTQVVMSNMIAYEVSPNSKTKPIFLSYTIFMKSLLQSTADVKELQEKGILLNKLANHEQVVKVFKGIDTFGFVDTDIFRDVSQRVEEHCRNKAKTWITDLIHTRFHSPWTAIALFATILLLCLTFLQTYFTIHPVK